MKKLHLLFVIGVIICFSACQKELTTSQTSTDAKRVSKAGPITDSYYSSILTLVNGSTSVYNVSFNGTAFQVSGLTYDDVDYAATEDGVPAIGTLSPVASDAQIITDFLQGGGSYFVYTLTSNGVTDSVNHALDNFNQAFNTWFNSSPSPDISKVPLLPTYLKNFYTTSGGVKVTTNGCKLIRRYLNGQSYYALAETDYPQAVVTPQKQTTANNYTCEIETNGVYYDLVLNTGTSGNITSVADAYTGTGSTVINTTGWTVAGTYSNLNKTSQTVSVSLTIYEPGTNSNVTYSGVANLGF